MNAIFLVALGGGCGAAARVLISGLIFSHTATWSFPLPTFVVNVAGCFLAGIVLGVSERFPLLHEEWRLFLVTGVLGGFTTFSAFGIESLFLLRRSLYLSALLYVVLSAVIGIGAVMLGTFLTAPTASSYQDSRL